MPPQYRFLLVEERAGVAIVKLNRPDKLNALNTELLTELESYIETLEKTTETRALILTGVGDKAFAAGADISELLQETPLQLYQRSLRGQQLLDRIEQLPIPTIAAINGYALGGGLELALACTFRVAVPEARLGLPEVRLGIIPGYGGTQRLPRLIGLAKAQELIATGEMIEAQEALRIGLVNHVVPKGELLDFCLGLVRKILSNAPRAVEEALKVTRAALDLPLQQGLSLEAASFSLCAATKDRIEGMKAFLEKRNPVFTGE